MVERGREGEGYGERVVVIRHTKLSNNSCMHDASSLIVNPSYLLGEWRVERMVERGR